MKKKNGKFTLSHDLILAILCMLHLKVIATFKCVSKEWKSLIEDNIDMTIKSKIIALLLGSSQDYVNYIDNHRFLHNLGSLIRCEFVFTVLTDCCNGLLLLRCNSSSRSQRSGSVVCNPHKKEYAFLPDPYPQDRIRNIDAALAFDPCVSPNYKVIQFSDIQRSDEDDDQRVCYKYKVNIFSSENWGWREFKFELLMDGKPDYLCWKRKTKPKPLYFKGSVYRLSTNTWQLLKFLVETDYGDESVRRVKAIPLPWPAPPKVDGYECVEVAKGNSCKFCSDTTPGMENCIFVLNGGRGFSPNCLPSSPYHDCLGVADGSIYYAISEVGLRFHRASPNLSLKIWMLKSLKMDDEYEWVLKFSAPIESIAGNLPVSSMFPSAFDPSSFRIFLGCTFSHGAGYNRILYPSFYTFDLITKKLQRHGGTFSFDESEDFSCYVFPCVPSNVPLVTSADLQELLMGLDD